MARLPSLSWLIQQHDGMVGLFHEGTGEVLVKFDPSNADETARAQHIIHLSDRLTDEDKCFAHFWSGYFRALAPEMEPPW